MYQCLHNCKNHRNVLELYASFDSEKVLFPKMNLKYMETKVIWYGIDVLFLLIVLGARVEDIGFIHNSHECL